MHVLIPLILGVLFLAAHARLILRTGKEKRGKGTGSASQASAALLTLLDVVCVAYIVVAYGFIALMVLAFCIFEFRWYMKLCFILAGLLTFALGLGLLLHRFNKRRFACWLVCALLVGGVLGGVTWHDEYLRSITLPERFDYRTFLPFQPDSLVQTLDEPATLRFSDGDALPRMDGATALYPVYAAFCQAVYPPSLGANGTFELEKTIHCGTTAWAYKGIVDGDCDIIFVAGPSREQEAYAAEKGVELVYTPIGREAFVFFVHPDNPLDSIRLDELRRIYSGELTQWEQLGVSGLGKILAYQRDEGSGSQTALERFVMRDAPLMPAETEKVIGDMGGIVEQVSVYKNHKNAIGYSFRFYCTALMKGFDVKLLALDGVAPTAENVENGSYPLADSFYAVTRSDANENTAALLDWITGAQGQSLVAKTGYTPLMKTP